MSSFSIEAEITFNQSFGMSWRFAPTYRALLVAVLPVLLAGCSSRFGQKPKPYILPDELTITAHAERGPEVAGRAIHIAGSTNFPDGMKMWVQVEDGRFPPCTARIKTSNNTDYNVIVQDGHFRTRDLWDIGIPFSAGTHQVCFSAFFNTSWQSPSVLAMLGGKGGRALHGKILKLTDLDVIDSDQELEDLETALFPPLPPEAAPVVVPPLPPSEAKAISLVKKAVLTEPGKGRSAGTVEETVAWFTSSATGIRPLKGWSATAKTDGVYDVTFDFINGKGGPEEQALWTANIKTGEVKYVNMKAKTFSWLGPAALAPAPAAGKQSGSRPRRAMSRGDRHPGATRAVLRRPEPRAGRWREDQQADSRKSMKTVHTE